MLACCCAVALVLFLIQFLAAAIFPGTASGIQRPLNAVSFTAWGLRGLMLNEFTDEQTWGCPGGLIPHDIPVRPGETIVLGNMVGGLLMCMVSHGVTWCMLTHDA